MADLPYVPLDPSLLAPGLPITTTDHTLGASTGLQAVGKIDRWIQTTYSPPLFCSQFGRGSATTVGASTNASSGSPETLGRWLIRGNATRRTIVVSCWALVNAGSTTGALRVSHGGVTASASVNSTTAVAVDIEVTPTSGSSPLELTISGYTDNSNHVILLAASARMKEGGSSSGGVGADGYAPLGELTSYNADSAMFPEKPVSTELMSRGYNNVRALARDRVACVATMQRPQNETTTRNDWTNNETAMKLVGFFHVPAIERVERQGVISIYTTTSAAATCKATVLVDGSQSFHTTHTSSSAEGAWAHHTISLPRDGCTISFYVRRTAGSGYCGITAAQLWRAI